MLVQSIDDGGDRGPQNRVVWGLGRLLEGLRDIALLLLLTRQPVAQEVHLAIRVNVRQAAAIWHLDDPVAVQLLLSCACCVKPRDIGGAWCSPQAGAQQTKGSKKQSAKESLHQHAVHEGTQLQDRRSDPPICKSPAGHRNRNNLTGGRLVQQPCRLAMRRRFA